MRLTVLPSLPTTTRRRSVPAVAATTGLPRGALLGAIVRHVYLVAVDAGLLTQALDSLGEALGGVGPEGALLLLVEQPTLLVAQVGARRGQGGVAVCVCVCVWRTGDEGHACQVAAALLPWRVPPSFALADLFGAPPPTPASGTQHPASDPFFAVHDAQRAQARPCDTLPLRCRLRLRCR